MPRMKIKDVKFHPPAHEGVNGTLEFVTKHGTWWAIISPAGFYSLRIAGRSFYDELIQPKLEGSNNQILETDDLIGRYLYLKKKITVYEGKPVEILTYEGGDMTWKNLNGLRRGSTNSIQLIPKPKKCH